MNKLSEPLFNLNQEEIEELEMNFNKSSDSASNQDNAIYLIVFRIIFK